MEREDEFDEGAGAVHEAREKSKREIMNDNEVIDVLLED